MTISFQMATIMTAAMKPGHPLHWFYQDNLAQWTGMTETNAADKDWIVFDDSGVVDPEKTFLELINYVAKTGNPLDYVSRVCRYSSPHTMLIYLFTRAMCQRLLVHVLTPL